MKKLKASVIILTLCVVIAFIVLACCSGYYGIEYILQIMLIISAVVAPIYAMLAILLLVDIAGSHKSDKK